MGQARQFYWKWFKGTFWDAPSAADGYAGLIGTVVAIGNHYYPKVGQIMDPLTWQIPIWLFGAILIFRFFHAPFQIWIEDQEKLAKLVRLENVKSSRVALAKLLTDGQEIFLDANDMDKPVPMKMAEDWITRAIATLTQEFDESYLARFNNAFGTPPVYSGNSSQERLSVQSALRFRLFRLNEFISEFAKSP